MMRFCSREHCAGEAKWAPKLCVPAQGYPIGSHDPLACIFNLPVCNQHVGELKPAEFLDPDTEGGAALRMAFEAMAGERVPPDFARAFFQRVSLNSPEFRLFEKRGGGDG